MMFVRHWVPALVCLAAAVAAQGPPQFVERIGQFELGTTTEDSRAVALGDVDGDGDLDAVVGNADDQRNRLYLNDGAGVFHDVTEARLPVDDGEASEIAFVDVDLDGDLDIFFTSRDSIFEGRKLYINDGTGAFTDETQARGIDRTIDSNGFAFGDFDGDGDPDLVVGPEIHSVGALMHWNDGRGFFTPGLIVSSPSMRPECFATGDVDGDGDLDLVVGQAGSGTWASSHVLFRNDGTGYFTTDLRWIAPTRDDDTRAVVLADLDGDGDLDLAAANEGAADEIIENRGGLFVPFRDPLPFDATRSHDVAALDADGDGDTDLLFAIAGEPSRLYLNDGAARFTRSPPTWFAPRSEATYAVAAGDLDGDGRADVFQANHGPNGIWFAPPSGGFADALRADLPVLDAPLGWLAAGDIDGDRAPDLVAVDAAGTVRILHNDRTGALGARLPGFEVVEGKGSTLADVDGDGALDLIVLDRYTRVLYRNPGGGDFGAATPETLPGGRTSDERVFAADLDRDGDTDLVVISSRHDYLLNDGSGMFTAASFGSGVGSVRQYEGFAAVGDIDRDGDPDVVFDQSEDLLRVYVNDGAAGFTDETAARLPARLGQGVALADIDGDGDLDLAVGPNRLLVNDGAGVFTDETTTRLPSAPLVRGSFTFADIDLDGDPDLLGTAGVLVNDGSGVFAANDRLQARLRTHQEIVVEDLDLDGDPDWLFGGVERARAFRNLHRDVWTPSALARGGDRVEWSVSSEPGYATQAGTVVLWLAGATLDPPVAVPPLGTWFLDPSRVFQLPPQALAAGESRAAYALRLPPGWAHDLSCQAVTVRGVQLSGAGLTGSGTLVIRR